MRLDEQAEIQKEPLRDLKQLDTLRRLNANSEWRNTDIYRLLYKEDFYHVAYERVKSKLGNMISDADSETLDDYSKGKVVKTISLMKEETYQPKPSKVTYIPKKNGKPRKLGIPSPRDKVIQEVVRLILEAIYDSPEGAYFEESSHSFRANRSPHTALREVQRKWSGVNWFIEGDLKACFDGIDHAKLMEILHEKVQDQRFLNLVRKLLKSGYIDREWRLRNSVIGTPQGGVLSPILANIFLDKLDKYVEQLRIEYEKGEARQANRVYRALAARKEKLVKHGLTKTKEFRDTVREMRDIPSLDPRDKNFIRIKYVRYADDWLIGVIGPRGIAEEIKAKVREFLENELKLTFGEEKAKITHAKTEQAQFLGLLISIGRSRTQTQKVTLSTNGSGHYFKRRATGWEVILKAPIEGLVKKLAEKSYCDMLGKPKAKGAFVGLDADQIIMKYSSVNRGILQYYRPCDNYVELRRIQYILKFSLAKTLAEKYKKTVPQVFTKGQLLTKYTSSKGEEKTVKFFINRDWKTHRDAFSKNPEVDQVRLELRLRTKSKLGRVCIMCGAEEDVEMHHVRHLRKLDERQQKAGFIRVMQALNRKQLPLCCECHDKVHAGTYDGIKLRDLKYDPRLRKTGKETLS